MIFKQQFQISVVFALNMWDTTYPHNLDIQALQKK